MSDGILDRENTAPPLPAPAPRRAGAAALAALLAAVSGCIPTEPRGGPSALEGADAVAAGGCADDGDAHPLPEDASALDARAADDDASLGAADAPLDAWSGAVLPTSGFRLEATPLRAEVLRGASVTFEVNVVRALGFDLPVVVQAAGLPAGVTAEPVAADARPASLVVRAEGLAPSAERVAFAIHGYAAGHRATLRAEIAVTGPPIYEE